MSDRVNDNIAKALGRVPSGCAILTVRTESVKTGMLASWIQQVAFEPPMIAAAVKRDRPIEPLIDEARGFVLNLLGENPGAMFKHFGKGFAPEEDAFAGLDIREMDSGIVIPDQIAWMSVRVTAKHAAGDHWVYFGEVTNAQAGEILPPYVHLRKNGLSY